MTATSSIALMWLLTINLRLAYLVWIAFLAPAYFASVIVKWLIILAASPFNDALGYCNLWASVKVSLVCAEALKKSQKEFHCRYSPEIHFVVLLWAVLSELLKFALFCLCIVLLHLCARHVNVLISFLWRLVSASGLLSWPEWWETNPTSGYGSSEERSPVVSRFSKLVFPHVPGTATEQVRTCGFRRNSRQVSTRHPRYVTPFCWVPYRVSWSLYPRSPRRPGRCNLGLTQGQVHSVLYCFYCLQAFLLKLPLISSCFLMLPYLLNKNLVSGEDWIYFVLYY